MRFRRRGGRAFRRSRGRGRFRARFSRGKRGRRRGRMSMRSPMLRIGHRM